MLLIILLLIFMVYAYVPELRAHFYGALYIMEENSVSIFRKNFHKN